MIFGLLLRDIKNNISLLKGHGEWDFKNLLRKQNIMPVSRLGVSMMQVVF